MTASPWTGRRVLVTGHTGFKGAWLSMWLGLRGAEVTGFADGVPTSPSLFEAAAVAAGLCDVRGDVRDLAAVAGAVERSQPEVVFHLAAQPLVRESYTDPLGTLATNVLGTAHVLEAVRHSPTVRVVVVVTSDKCYDNTGRRDGYAESDPLGGADVYSASKAAAELVAGAYRRSFPFAGGAVVCSARAGNVLGGGDWAADRIVPDLMRGARAGTATLIRNPSSVRPWQDVFDCLAGYLALAEAALTGAPVAGSWNFGPEAAAERTVGWLVEQISTRWPGGIATATASEADGPAEAAVLTLDSTKARTELGWRPAPTLDACLDRLVEWHAAFDAGGDVAALSRRQLRQYRPEWVAAP